MDIAGELVQIYKLLEEQEAKLIDLQRHLRALVTILESHPQLFDSYQSIYRGLGNSMVLREFEPAIEMIHEKMRVLSERAHAS
jgi:hypothetical protein